MSHTVVDEPPEFARSILALPEQLPAVDLREVLWRVFEFRNYKTEHGNVPFRRYGEASHPGRTARGALSQLTGTMGSIIATLRLSARTQFSRIASSDRTIW